MDEYKKEQRPRWADVADSNEDANSFANQEQKDVESVQKIKHSKDMVALVETQAATCPSSSLYCGLKKNAAGDSDFVGPFKPTPGECLNVAHQLPEDAPFKLCGPGTFTLSRMTCDQHDYKAVSITHPSSAFTASTCKLYNMADYYQIDGYLGSMKFTCDSTSR